MILLLASGALGGWLVHKANLAYDGMKTCRYRDFYKLGRVADRYSASYAVVGLASLTLPGGPLVATAVFGYAAYRRFK